MPQPMMNPVLMQQPDSLEAIELQRRQAMADVLKQQAMAPIEQQTVSGGAGFGQRVVPISPMQGVAKLAQALAGRQMQSNVDDQARQYATNQSQKLAALLSSVGQESDPTKQAVMLGSDPRMAPYAMKMLEMAQQQKMHSQNKMEELQFRAQDSKERQAERLAQQKELAAQQDALRRELAANASSDKRFIASMMNARQEQKNVPKLPPAALKMQQEDLEAIGTSSSIKADIDALNKQIDSGALDLGLASNVIAKGRNAVGMSNEQSRNFASFQATLEKMRNDSLRLNKGVQTEGDAVRAWNELVANINDPKVVKQRLNEISSINDRAANIRQMNIDSIRSNFGVEPMDVSGYRNQPAAVGGGAKGSNIDALLKKYGG